MAIQLVAKCEECSEICRMPNYTGEEGKFVFVSESICIELTCPKGHKRTYTRDQIVEAVD